MNTEINIACPSSPWVPFYIKDRCYNGYTLFTPMGGSVAWLIDMQGHPVHCWEMAYPQSSAREILSNGNLLYSGTDLAGRKDGSGNPYKVIVEADWDSRVIWEYRDPLQHHAFCRLDNGNTMVLRQVTMSAAMTAKVKGGVPGSGRGGTMRTDAFQEVTPDGKVVWEWLAYDHLDPNIDVLCPICSRGSWTHTNSCCILPNGDVMTTFHHLDTIGIIDKKTGDIKWRWGVGELAHPHNPTWLDNGNILVFDNGQHRKETVQNFSRVVEVNPKTGKIEWEYKANPPQSFYTSVGSCAQRLPNGNTLICEQQRGRFFEVTRDKAKVWEYINPFYFEDKTPTGLGLSNRAGGCRRYSPDFVGFQGRELNPNRIELTVREAPMWKENAMLSSRG